MKLLRFKDNTYSWLTGDASPILNEAETIAYGVWQLHIPRDEINLGITNLKATATMKKDNVAVFGNTKKLYLYTAKVGHDTSSDEHGEIL